ncbi:ester cyclase [Streptomyces sp. TX20-6-3]|uniref:ester cyclase n=1 Tax=Streptomyces sp. TX20-6-3 TaxID=3028705 RepID=UPI0029A5F06E|nr:ester cyclase [Streptomyces sp. TX20-6-3]MDX2561242.1 ester cyclase [Streptomyces sp. TX20-6-3]
MTTAPEQNTALLRTAYRAVESGDLDAAERLMTEDFIAHVPGLPEPLVGRDVWRLGTQTMKDAFPDLTINVKDIFGVGDKVTVLLRFEGTHRGTFQQIEATGRRVRFDSIEVYRVEGDRIAEEWVAPDMLSLIQQISPAVADH